MDVKAMIRIASTVKIGAGGWMGEKAIVRNVLWLRTSLFYNWRRVPHRKK